MHHLRQHLQNPKWSGFFAALLVFSLLMQGLVTGFSHGAMAAMPQGAALCLSSPHDAGNSEPPSHNCPCGIVCQSTAFTPALPFGTPELHWPTHKLRVAAQPVAISATRKTPRDLGVISDVRGPPSLLMNS